MVDRNCVDQLDLFNDTVGCVTCGGALTTARQLKYCSPRCKSKASYQAQLASGYRAQGAGREKRKAWMDANRERLNEHRTERRVCCRCGTTYATRWLPQRYCSRACWGAANHEAWPAKPPKPPYVPPQPGPVRRAFIDQDWSALMEALRERSTLSASGCWEWMQRLDESGYGLVRTGGNADRKYQLAHRVMAMAMTCGDIASHLVVHHKCANRRCICPGHLQVVLPHENAAEMLERNYYLRRIADLEATLDSYGHGQ